MVGVQVWYAYTVKPNLTARRYSVKVKASRRSRDGCCTTVMIPRFLPFELGQSRVLARARARNTG